MKQQGEMQVHQWGVSRCKLRILFRCLEEEYCVEGSFTKRRITNALVLLRLENFVSILHAWASYTPPHRGTSCKDGTSTSISPLQPSASLTFRGLICFKCLFVLQIASLKVNLLLQCIVNPAFLTSKLALHTTSLKTLLFPGVTFLQVSSGR